MRNLKQQPNLPVQKKKTVLKDILFYFNDVR